MTDAEARAQVNAAAERVTRRPRWWLEQLDDAVGAYLLALREHGVSTESDRALLRLREIKERRPA